MTIWQLLDDHPWLALIVVPAALVGAAVLRIGSVLIDVFRSIVRGVNR